MPSHQRNPARPPAPRSVAWSQWIAFAASMLALVALAAWSERLPPAASPSAPAQHFSAGRARATLVQLADSIGHRVPGTDGHGQAREYLIGRLRAIPGVQVEEQDVTGARAGARSVRAYRVRNVVARIPGRQRAAVLISSHYDSPTSSVGAADAAAPVAVMVEVARALAAGPTPEHTVVLNFNDAEEQGLLGAHAFLRHRWFADVRAFLNLESAGNQGKAILFQAGPGNAWLAARHARSVPHPYGSVIGQDIFQSGLIPSGTDFEIYTGGGVPGLDVALYRGGWAYHTPLDRAASVADGSLQHMGDNALAVARALAAGPLPGDVGGSPAVYFDVLGLFMLSYDHAVAAVLALVALGLLAWALRRVVSRELVTAREILVATLLALAGIAMAWLLALGGAAIGPLLLGRAHGWFAHPARAVVAYGALALAGLLAAQWILARGRAARAIEPERRAIAALSGALVLHALALAAFTIMRVGSGYLFLWWVMGGALGLIALGARQERWRLALAAIALLPAAVVTTQVAYLLVELFVPVAGRFPADIPFDLVLAGVIAVPATVLLAAPVALLQRGGRLDVTTSLALGTALGALATIWLSEPYTANRPQRIVVVHEDDGATSRLVMRAMDHPGLGRVATALDIARDSIRETGALRLPAPSLDNPTAEVVLVAERATSGAGREIELLLRAPDAFEVTLQTPDSRPVVWRPEGVPDSLARAVPRLTLVAAPDSGWRITLRVPDDALLPLEISTRRHRPSPAADSLIARLPEWTTAYGETVVRRTVVY